jgi:thioredoxin-like negative regulator of GroEL
MIDALAAKFADKVKLLKIDVNKNFDNTALARKFGILHIPTTILLRYGQVVDYFKPIPQESQLIDRLEPQNTIPVLAEEKPMEIPVFGEVGRKEANRVKQGTGEIELWGTPTLLFC